MLKDISLNILRSINNIDDNVTTYLGNKGYTILKKNLPTQLINNIKKNLLIKPLSLNCYIENSSYPIYLESENKLYVPRFWGITYFGIPKTINISYGININLKFNGKLRKEPINQEEIVDKFLKEINFDKNLLLDDNDKLNKGNSCGLIELKTGGGKTVIGLKILSIINKKTIIFVHKTFLKDQWIERINEFLPEAKIGTIQGQIIDIEDKDIVIAMIQSISMKEYPENIFKDFGFSLYDECHHLSSEVFSNCLKKCNTIYSLGLSATMERKDGLTHVFKMYLGNICEVSMNNKKDYDNVLVKVINYNVKDDEEFITTELDFRGNAKYSTMISKLSNYDYRNDFIVYVIHNEFKLNTDQQMMILCHNRNMLQYLFKKISINEKLTVGFYVGGMKKDDLKISETKQVILATYQMAAEALDIKTLTSLILATPKTDIVQAVGRILREKHKNPLVIDIVDVHNCFQNQFLKRKTFYNKENYKMIKTTNEEYINYYNTEYSEKNMKENIWSEIKKRNKKSNTKENIEHDVEKKCLI
jgi:superfamily II DNA or RNA helicase